MPYSWHQQQAIRRDGVPDYSHPTRWTVVDDSRDMVGIIRFETQAEAEAYVQNTRQRHGHDGWIVPPTGFDHEENEHDAT